MYEQNNMGSFPYPLPMPISPQMPMNQQMSMQGLNTGIEAAPLPSMNYNFAQYKQGGKVHDLQQMIERVRNQGEDEDEILAYINPEEAQELDSRYGHDINQQTGLPQYGFFKKTFKKVLPAVRKALPVIGAVAGNYVAPGVGGVVGGGVGGALSGKKPLKGALTGSAMGAFQGYGLPYLGKMSTAGGMPQLGQALTQLGGSRFAGALSSLGSSGGMGAPGMSAFAPSAKNAGLAALLNQAGGGARGSSGGLPDLLNYALLGLTAAGAIGGKTKYKKNKQYANEGSLEEMIDRIKKRQWGPEDQPRNIAPYEMPEELYDIPEMVEMDYDYPRFSKGGKVRKFMYGGNERMKIQRERADLAKQLNQTDRRDNRNFQMISRKLRDLNQQLKDFDARASAQPKVSAPITPILSGNPEKQEVEEKMEGELPFLGSHENLPNVLMNLVTMGGLLGNQVSYVPEEEKKEISGNANYKKGGFIDGDSGGQADNRPAKLKEGDYTVDATTVSLLGDGNTKAGIKQLDDLVKKFSHLRQPFAKGEKVKSIPALVSDGEYIINRDIVSSLGKGNNNLGAARIKKMIANIRKHKGVKGLPKKSKPLISYLNLK